MTDTPENDPELVLEEPSDAPPNIWMRGLFMIVFAIFFGVAETLLAVMAVVQFAWMLIKKEPNAQIANFGAQLSRWLAAVAQFQTGSTEDKPFPWGKWG